MTDMNLRILFSWGLLAGILSIQPHLHAQSLNVDYPYNPDADEDSLVGVADLMGLLSTFGDEFEPAAILVNEVGLADFLMAMMTTIEALEAQVAALEAVAMPELSNHLTWDEDMGTFELSGANLQISNGLEDNSANGLGNLIIGHNEENPNDSIGRGGSHMLVVGDYHAYSGVNGIVSGYNARITGNHSAIIAGSNNQVDASHAVVVGGNLNQVNTGGQHSAVFGGRENLIVSSFATTAGGQGNVAGTDSTDARFSLIAGGRFNELQSGYCGTIAGGYGNLLQSDTTGVGQQARSIVGGSGNVNKGSSGASIVGGWGSHLLQRVGHDGRNDLLIGTDAFIGNIHEDNSQNVRVTGELEEN